MSDVKTAPARVIPGTSNPAPPYFYQSYDGRGSSASATPRHAPTQKFSELQNLVVPA